MIRDSDQPRIRACGRRARKRARARVRTTAGARCRANARACGGLCVRGSAPAEKRRSGVREKKKAREQSACQATESVSVTRSVLNFFAGLFRARGGKSRNVGVCARPNDVPVFSQIDRGDDRARHFAGPPSPLPSRTTSDRSPLPPLVPAAPASARVAMRGSGGAALRRAAAAPPRSAATARAASLSVEAESPLTRNDVTETIVFNRMKKGSPGRPSPKRWPVPALDHLRAPRSAPDDP